MNMTEISTQGAAMVPPGAVIGLSILGYPIADWAWAATFVYAALQGVLILPKIVEQYSPYFRKRRGVAEWTPEQDSPQLPVSSESLHQEAPSLQPRKECDTPRTPTSEE